MLSNVMNEVSFYGRYSLNYLCLANSSPLISPLFHNYYLAFLSDDLAVF